MLPVISVVKAQTPLTHWNFEHIKFTVDTQLYEKADRTTNALTTLPWTHQLSLIWLW